jgi:hypothetical protein
LRSLFSVICPYMMAFSWLLLWISCIYCLLPWPYPRLLGIFCFNLVFSILWLTIFSLRVGSCLLLWFLILLYFSNFLLWSFRAVFGYHGIVHLFISFLFHFFHYSLSSLLVVHFLICVGSILIQCHILWLWHCVLLGGFLCVIVVFITSGKYYFCC